MGFIGDLIEKIGDILDAIGGRISSLLELPASVGPLYTAVARWVFIGLALIILLKAIFSLLSSRSSAEVWAYFNVSRRGDEEGSGGPAEDGAEERPEEDMNYPITHWENAIGRSGSSDLRVDDPAVSRTQGTLTRDDRGRWRYKDLGSRNGTLVKGRLLSKGQSAEVEPGDQIVMGETVCTLFPISLEERRNNLAMRKEESLLRSSWATFVALTVFQLMTVVQLRISLGDDFSSQIPIAFIGLTLVMWAYLAVMRVLGRKGFEMESIALFLSTLSLAVTASKYPGSVMKQFAAILIGLCLFIFMCWFLRNIDRTKAARKFMYPLAAAALLLNLLIGTTKFGASNWVIIGGLSVQPSEIVKLAFIWVGAASLDELMERRNSLIFTIFAAFCFVCLALMGDFGTALIFFVSYLVISFLRSGDFTKLILIVGVAFAGALLVLRYKSYIANRFAAWGHVWEFADEAGYQQTRTMSAAASGGLVGVGAGGGWLKDVAASETDLVFGFITEEWGLIIAILAVLAIVTLSIFAVRSIWAGRSTYYTIAACSAMSLFLFQTMLNVFGSVDLFPLTGVTFPFLSTGGTSMVSSWGMLAFLKAADTRLNASIAVSQKVRGLGMDDTGGGPPAEREVEDA